MIDLRQQTENVMKFFLGVSALNWLTDLVPSFDQ
jgi:hypothetical protein